jgi:hypothetical protein
MNPSFGLECRKKTARASFRAEIGRFEHDGKIAGLQV